MAQKALFFKLFLVYFSSQSLAQIQANCKEDVLLKCHGASKSMNFASLTWYKINMQKKSGIVRKSDGVSETQLFNFHRDARFGENFSLVLPSVSPEDSGNYECVVSSKVGGQNLNVHVKLTVPVCVTDADLTTMTNIWNTTFESDQGLNQHAEELPVMWTILGFLAVAFAKAVLSLISILVLDAVRARSSRRKQEKR